MDLGPYAEVTMEDFEKWKAALKGRADVTFVDFSRGNHMFIDGTGPSSPPEYTTAGHVAEEVVRTIAAWIRGR